jgi:hypothetical protein
MDGRDRAAAALRCLSRTAAWGYEMVVVIDRLRRHCLVSSAVAVMDGRERAAAVMLAVWR